MIKSFVCVCGLLVSLNVVAASLKPIKGKVVDRFNNPLPGATIQRDPFSRENHYRCGRQLQF